MNDKIPTRLIFLSWDSPWPVRSGCALRTLGLLSELSKAFEVELVLLTRHPLSVEQTALLNGLTHAITIIPLKDVFYGDKLRAAMLILKLGHPYHSAILEASFRDYPDVLKRIRGFPGVVYASGGHWGTLVYNQKATNWVLDQHNADVDFWRVYASQATNLLVKLAALINRQLADKHFRRIYPCVGRIVSVCEDDRQLTLALAPHAQVEVIENGVDCSYYVPNRQPHTGPPQLLFTGTSTRRNMTALHKFVRNTFPLIQRELPDVDLLVGGNFSIRAQAKFRKNHNIRFTGSVDDMRPVFNQSDVFIAPFEATHGSKLKIAEAMAMGMAIVSTAPGIRGFPLVEGESVFVAHDNEQFAANCVALLSDSLQRENLGAAARKVALSSIDFQVLGKRLVSIVESVAHCDQ